jgi:hypothetical protein
MYAFFLGYLFLSYLLPSVIHMNFLHSIVGAILSTAALYYHLPRNFAKLRKDTEQLYDDTENLKANYKTGMRGLGKLPFYISKLVSDLNIVCNEVVNDSENNSFMHELTLSHTVGYILHDMYNQLLIGNFGIFTSYRQLASLFMLIGPYATGKHGNLISIYILFLEFNNFFSSIRNLLGYHTMSYSLIFEIIIVIVLVILRLCFTGSLLSVKENLRKQWYVFYPSFILLATMIYHQY